MKPNYYFKGTGQPIAHINIKFDVTSAEIEQEVWYQIHILGIPSKKVYKWSREHIEKHIKSRFQDDGRFAYSREEFEPFIFMSFDKQPTPLMTQIIEFTRRKFPEFYEFVKVTK